MLAEIHQIIRVDDERVKVILGPKANHFLAHWMAQFIRRPLAWAGGKNLQRIAAQAVGTLGGIVDSSGSGGMNADASGSEAWRAFWCGTGENIWSAGHGAGHGTSISRDEESQAWLVRVLRLRCSGGNGRLDGLPHFACTGATGQVGRLSRMIRQEENYASRDEGARYRGTGTRRLRKN